MVAVGERIESWQELSRLSSIDHPDGPAMATRFVSRRFPGNPSLRSLKCHGYSNHLWLILEPIARGLGFAVLPQYARLAFARQDRIQVERCGVEWVDTL